VADEPKKIEFHYEVDPAYRVVAANSVLTTTTGFGDIKIDFLIDSFAIPKSVTHEVTADGKIGKMLEVKPGERQARHVQIGVLVSLDQATKIADFINEEVAKAKKALDQKPKP